MMAGNFDPSDTENMHAPPTSGNHNDARIVSGGMGNISGGETPVFHYQISGSQGLHYHQGNKK